MPSTKQKNDEKRGVATKKGREGNRLKTTTGSKEIHARRHSSRRRSSDVGGRVKGVRESAVGSRESAATTREKKDSSTT